MQGSHKAGVFRERAMALAFLAATLAATLAAAFSASTARAADAPAPGAGVHGVAPRGFVYRVTRPGEDGVSSKILYLYGTLHVGRGGGAGLDAATQTLVLNCQHVAIELDPRDQVGIARAIQAYGKYPDGDHLSMHVDADLDAHAVKVAESLQLPRERVEQMRPWMLSNVLSVLSLIRAGLDPRRGSEALLAAQAARDQADVIEIEGADAQLKLLGHAAQEVQVDALKRTLQQIDSGHISDEASELLDAWDKSDVAAMEKVLKDLSDEHGPYPKFMTDVLLKERDASMADAAEKQMAQSGDTLFAVGALHLFGSDGLINSLRQRGYTVTAVTSGT